MKYTLSLFSLLLCTLTLFAQTDKEKVETTITKAKIEGQIYFLADDLLKGRETGTPENKIAASYLANSLRSYGVKTVGNSGTYYQEVKLNKTTPPKNVKLNINGNDYKNKVALKAHKMDYSGETMFLGYGLEDDYKGKDVKGKTILIKAGNAETTDARAAFGLIQEKQNLAKANGVKAVVEFLDTNATIWNFIDHNFNAPNLKVASMDDKNPDEDEMAYLWVLDEGAVATKSLESSKSNKIELMMDAETKTPVLSQNVVGMVEGTDPKLKNEYIIYSAHYDHVGIGAPDKTGDSIYNGARDNAVGTTTVLSMAENLAKFPAKRSALFILFTGEEKGLLGSQYYVENPLVPLKQMVYCFNSDNGGYNDTSVISIIGLPRTTATKNIKEAATAFGLTAIDDAAPEQNLFDRSDNVNFAKMGIPAPTFSLGYRSFDGDVTKYYHQPSDEADSMDYDYLLKFFKAYVLSGRLIANDPKTPTWTKGDKYEAAGKTLYGM